MDTQKLVQESLNTLKENGEARSYFETDIQWLEKQSVGLKKNKIRIGLIGVTSSGKSTILNALLGERLLPTAVRPSSGILITCSKAKQKQATIYFENGNPIILKGEEIKKKVNLYGDEENNKKNKYKVKYIDITTPSFLLDENIQIIDSPGLEAYGLEYHETLTLETLLPSVDLCLYAVTMKANSDESTFRMLQAIQKHKKPLIIIQNMLDSVEPKKGKGGEILKTKEQVALEHRKRIKRIIEKVNESNKIETDINSLVDIVQISAKDALRGRINNDEYQLQKSRINNLILSLKENLKRFQLFMSEQRKQQIIRHLKEVIENEKGSLQENNKIKQQQLNQLETYKSQKKVVKKEYQNTYQQIESRLITIEKEVEKTLASISKLEEDDIEQGESLNTSLRTKVSKLEKDIIDYTWKVNNQINQSLKILNLNQHDLNNNMIIREEIKRPQFNTKKRIAQRTRMVEKSGPISKFTRFLGDKFNTNWGYREEDYEVEVLDISAMEMQIKTESVKIIKELSNFIEQWEERVYLSIDKLDNEVKRKEKEIRQKNEYILDEITATDIINKLESIIKMASKTIREQGGLHSTNKNKEQYSNAQELKTISIDSALLGIYQLANHFIYSHFKPIWKYCQEDNFEQLPFKQTVIWGWDEVSLTHFIRRFLNHSLEDNEMNQLREKGYCTLEIDNQNLVLVLESKKLSNDVDKILKNERYNVYVLINTIQMGATMKQLKKSYFLKMQQIQPGVINWINQSVVEFKGQNMGEGLQGLYDIINEYRSLNQGYVLMNDENPIYSILMLELSRYNKFTIADETNLMKQISSKYSYLLKDCEKEDCVQLIRTYMDSKGVKV